jgi:hypothetical protein
MTSLAFPGLNELRSSLSIGGMALWILATSYVARALEEWKGLSRFYIMF